eukprot:scaffold30530_cov43-Attheya_sp.AAC.1
MAGRRRRQAFVSNSMSLILPMEDAPLRVPNVLLVECGFGNDSHGQNATKAAGSLCVLEQIIIYPLLQRDCTGTRFGYGVNASTI